MKTFRIDDICINTEEKKLLNMFDLLDKKYKKCNFLLGISPLVNDMSLQDGSKKERIFPSIFNAYSDHRIFYSVEKLGIPSFLEKILDLYKNRILIASHGLIHVDHRLLTKEAQELSIITSCSLIKANYFIPPFNKYNKDTIEICNERKVNLVKFEDGWRHIKYEKIVDNFNNYYFHTHDFSQDEFNELLK